MKYTHIIYNKVLKYKKMLCKALKKSLAGIVAQAWQVKPVPPM